MPSRSSRSAISRRLERLICATARGLRAREGCGGRRRRCKAPQRQRSPKNTRIAVHARCRQSRTIVLLVSPAGSHGHPVPQPAGRVAAPNRPGGRRVRGPSYRTAVPDPRRSVPDVVRPAAVLRRTALLHRGTNRIPTRPWRCRAGRSGGRGPGRASFAETDWSGSCWWNSPSWGAHCEPCCSFQPSGARRTR